MKPLNKKFLPLSAWLAALFLSFYLAVPNVLTFLAFIGAGSFAGVVTFDSIPAIGGRA